MAQSDRRRQVPYLADHRIDGEIVMPGTGFAEMALAVAREIFPEGPIGLEDFDLLQWLPLPAGTMRELSVRLSGDTHVVEIWNRPRLSDDEWTLCARGRITRIASPAPAVIPKQDLPQRLTGEQVYDSATKAGVEYGPLFRRVLGATRSDTLIEMQLSPFDEASGVADRRQILHPIALDAAFHAMFENIKARAGERYAFLPVRFAGLRVDRDSGVPARARLDVIRETDNSLTIAVDLYDADGHFIAGLTGGLFRAVTLDRRKQTNVFFHRQLARLARGRRFAGHRHRGAEQGQPGLPPGFLVDSRSLRAVSGVFRLAVAVRRSALSSRRRGIAADHGAARPSSCRRPRL